MMNPNSERLAEHKAHIKSLLTRPMLKLDLAAELGLSMRYTSYLLLTLREEDEIHVAEYRWSTHLKKNKWQPLFMVGPDTGVEKPCSEAPARRPKAPEIDWVTCWIPKRMPHEGARA